MFAELVRNDIYSNKVKNSGYKKVETKKEIF